MRKSACQTEASTLRVSASLRLCVKTFQKYGNERNGEEIREYRA